MATKTPTSFQILSKKSDRNGIPYRLILVYSQFGTVIEAYEERSSLPNTRGNLSRRDLVELPSFHLPTKEYNDTKSKYSAILQKVD